MVGLFEKARHDVQIYCILIYQHFSSFFLDPCTFMFHCCFDIILLLFFLDGHPLTPCSCFSCFPGIRLAAAGRKQIYKHQTKKLKSLSTEALTLSTDAPFFFSCLMKGEHIFLNRTCFRFRLLNVISEMAVAVWKKLRVLYIPLAPEDTKIIHPESRLSEHIHFDQEDPALWHYTEGIDKLELKLHIFGVWHIAFMQWHRRPWTSWGGVGAVVGFSTHGYYKGLVRMLCRDLVHL